MDKEETRANVAVAGFAAALMLGLICMALDGCALVGNGEIYLGQRRVDEYQATQTMKDKPWKCVFFDCGGQHNDK